MITTEKRIKIGYDIHNEERYNNLKEAKISAYNELLEYIKDFIKTSEIDFNTSDLKTEIKNKVLAIYKTQFPSILTDEKVLELIGFMYSKLSALVERFQSIDIEFNTKTKEVPTKDFTIYSENSIQAKKYIKFKRLADELNDNLDNIQTGSMIKQQMCHVLNNIIFYNVVNHSFEPNINYIQKLK